MAAACSSLFRVWLMPGLLRSAPATSASRSASPKYSHHGLFRAAEFSGLCARVREKFLLSIIPASGVREGACAHPAHSSENASNAINALPCKLHLFSPRPFPCKRPVNDYMFVAERSFTQKAEKSFVLDIGLCRRRARGVFGAGS